MWQSAMAGALEGTVNAKLVSKVFKEASGNKEKEMEETKMWLWRICSESTRSGT